MKIGPSSHEKLVTVILITGTILLLILYLLQCGISTNVTRILFVGLLAAFLALTLSAAIAWCKTTIFDQSGITIKFLCFSRRYDWCEVPEPVLIHGCRMYGDRSTLYADVLLFAGKKKNLNAISRITGYADMARNDDTFPVLTAREDSKVEFTFSLDMWLAEHPFSSFYLTIPTSMENVIKENKDTVIKKYGYDEYVCLKHPPREANEELLSLLSEMKGGAQQRL